MRETMRSRILGAVSVAWLGIAARAQTLDLSGPKPPEPGEGRATLALAEDLRREAEEIRRASRAKRDRARAAVRELAASVLQAGERAGDAGSPAVLAGLTLAARRGAFDEGWLALELPDEAWEFVAEHAAPETPAPVLTGEARAVDLLLRDALAPITDELGRRSRLAGWGAPVEASSLEEVARRLEELADLRGLEEPASAAIRELAAMASLAIDHPSYAPSALDLASVVLDASRVLLSPPAWLGPESLDGHRSSFSIATARLFDDQWHDAANATLRRLSDVSSVVDLCEGLPESWRTAELRAAAASLVGAVPPDPRLDPAASGRVLEAARRIDSLRAGVEVLPDSAALVRQVRPAMGAMRQAWRVTDESLTRLLPIVLAQPDPMTDPALLATLGAAERAITDLRMLVSVSELLARWPGGAPAGPTREPVAMREVGALAERVRALGVGVTREADRERALVELRAIGELAPTLVEFPGERSLLGGEGGWGEVTGSRANELAGVLTRARRAWLESHSTDRLEQRRAIDHSRIVALRDGMRLLDLGASLVRGADGRGSLDAWAGWELSAQGRALVTRGLNDRLEALTTDLLGDAASRAVEREAALLRDDAPALLMAMLARDPARPALTPDPTGLGELALGAPPSGAWMIEHREALASICRAIHELVADPSDADRAAYLRTRALVVLRAIEGSPRK